MTLHVRSLLSLVMSVGVISATPAAADLPPISANANNQVPACATPGRLMVFLRENNRSLDPRFAKVAHYYRQHGDAIGVRWDYAFFQMVLETGYLSYKGDVRAHQNNFAGLGATGGGVPGESFPDISTGVLAHLQHLKMYSGAYVESPVADRTRKVQAWKVLVPWQNTFTRPITYADAANKWAPGSGNYVRDVRKIAQRFFEGPCVRPDPEAGQVIAQKKSTPAAPPKTERKVAQAAPVQPKAKPPVTTAQETATKATGFAAQGRALMAAVGNNTSAETKANTPKVTVLNSAPDQPKAEAQSPTTGALPSTAKAGAAKAKADKSAKTTAWSQKTPPVAAPKKKASPKCRVFTASYGGTKAIIIKAVASQTVNYTVLDVHEGAEKREAEAYINAYAKGGRKIGEFSNQPLALEKAFELCPDG